jgi:hypothetical protein
LRANWYWCAVCAQRWQLELIPHLQTEGCPLCGGEVVPILGRAGPGGDRPDRSDRPDRPDHPDHADRDSG